MKRLVVTLIGIALALEVSPTPARKPLFPQINPADKHRFLTGKDQLVLAGYYPGIQALIVHPQVRAADPLSSTYYRQLIDTMVDHDLNLLRVVLTMGMALENRDWLHPYSRSRVCCTAHAGELGVSGFRFDLDSFNQAFFDYWDAVLTYAEDKRVVMQVALLDGAHTRRRKDISAASHAPFEYIGWIYDYYHRRNNVNGIDFVGTQNGTEDWYGNPDVIDRQKAFIAKAVSELGHHPNLIWEIANEPQVAPPPPNGRGHPWLGEMRRAIQAAEAVHRLNHLIQPFDLPDHRNVSGFRTPGTDTHPTVYQQEYVAAHKGLVADFDANPLSVQPLIADNDCCVESGSPEQLRKKAWLSLVAGAYPSMLVYQVSGGSNPLGLDHGSTRAGMRYVGYTRRFVDLLGIDLVAMEPRDELLNVVSGGPAWCLARVGEGSAYVVVWFEGGTVSIPALAGRIHQTTWFDPVTGISTPVASSGASFTTPNANDWVVYIVPDDEPTAPKASTAR